MTYREVVEKRTGLQLKNAKQFEVGKKYYIGYWQKTLEVLETKQNAIYGTVHKVKWNDGTININSTRLDNKNDFEIIQEA